MPIRLEPFDPSRSFVCAAGFRAAGKLYGKSIPFDKTSVNMRVLEQLYEQRRIVYANAQPKMARGPKRVAQLLKGFVGSVREHHARTLTPVEAHEQLVAEKQIEDTEGSSGAQPPAADGGEGGSSKEPESQQEASAAPEQAASTHSTPDAEAPDSPNEDEAAAAPVGEAATAAATNAERDAKVEQLMIDHSQSQLLEMAKGIAGLNSKSSKKRIAEALVDAGLAE